MVLFIVKYNLTTVLNKIKFFQKKGFFPKMEGFLTLNLVFVNKIKGFVNLRGVFVNIWLFSGDIT